MEEEVNYWEFRAQNARSESEFRTAMDKMLRLPSDMDEAAKELWHWAEF